MERDNRESPAPRKTRGKSATSSPVHHRFSPVRPVRHPKYIILRIANEAARAVPTHDVPAISFESPSLSRSSVFTHTPPVRPTRKYLCCRLIYFCMQERAGCAGWVWPPAGKTPKSARHLSQRNLAGFVQRIGAEESDTKTRHRDVRGREINGIFGRLALRSSDDGFRATRSPLFWRDAVLHAGRGVDIEGRARYGRDSCHARDPMGDILDGAAH